MISTTLSVLKSKAGITAVSSIGALAATKMVDQGEDSLMFLEGNAFKMPQNNISEPNPHFGDKGMLIEFSGEINTLNFENQS